MDRKKILFIIPWLPYPFKSGGHQALFNGIYAVRNDFEVHIAYKIERGDKYLENKKQFLEILPNAILHPFITNNNDSLFYRIAYRIKGKIKKIINDNNSSIERKMCASWMSSISPLQESWLEHISFLCNNYHFDLIQVEMPWLLSQVLTLPNDQDTKKLFVHHELGFVRRELEQRQFEINEYVSACRTFVDNAEICMLNMYDAVVTLSPIDREKLVSHGVTVPVYSSIATVCYKKECSLCLGNGKLLSFVGPGSHSPNSIGMTWFLDNCWKELKKKDADYRLKVIGNWDHKYVTDCSSKYADVEFVGFVEDLEKEIMGTIMIVPITIGSGIRMKILEACSIGVPFVSTSVGAEGIPVVNGKHCYIADTPDAFVNSLIQLQQSDIQANFVQQARELVKNHYSQDVLRKNRMEIYDNILRL